MVQPLIIAARKAGDDTFDADYDAITAKAVEVAAFLEEPVEVLPAKKNIVNRANAALLAINQLRRRAGLPGVPFASRTDSDTASPADDLNTLVGQLNELIGQVSPPVDPVTVLTPPTMVGVTKSVKTSTTGLVGSFLLPTGARTGEEPVVAGERWVAFPGHTGDYRFQTPAGWQVVSGSERQVDAAWRSGIVAWWRDVTQADIDAGLPSTIDLTLVAANAAPSTSPVGSLHVMRVQGGARTSPPVGSAVGSDGASNTLRHPGVTIPQDQTLLLLGASTSAGSSNLTWDASGVFTGKTTSFVEAGNNDSQRATWHRATPAASGATGEIAVTASFPTAPETISGRWSLAVVSLAPSETVGDAPSGAVPPQTLPVIVDNKITTSSVTASSVTDVFTTNVPTSRATEYRLATDTGARTPHPYISPPRASHSATTSLPAADTAYDLWYTLTTEGGVEQTFGPYRRRTATATVAPPATGTGLSFGYSEPQLVNPIEYTAGGTKNYFYTADPNRDVLVTCTSTLTGVNGSVTGLAVVGGRNVVIRGADINHPADNNPGSGDSKSNRGITLQGNGTRGTASTTARTIFVNGCKFRGIVKDGFVVDLGGDKNVEIIGQDIDATGVTLWPGGAGAQNHPDLVQAWNGPLKFRFNRMYGKVSYQGMFLQQRMYGQETNYETWLDNVHIEGTSASAYLLWSSHDKALHVGENAPGSVSVYSQRYGPGAAADRYLWDSVSGGAGRGRWVNVQYVSRAPSAVLLNPHNPNP